MTRRICGFATALGLVCFAASSADAQVFYAYGNPFPAYAPAVVYPAPVYVAPRAVVTSAYAYPAPVAYSAGYAPQPIVQMAYSAPAPVVAAPVIASPVVVGPGAVRETTRVRPHGYTQTVRSYGPTYGPHYARVHVHHGLFGTTVRERSW
jgi:hypothetical protein